MGIWKDAATAYECLRLVCKGQLKKYGDQRDENKRLLKCVKCPCYGCCKEEEEYMADYRNDVVEEIRSAFCL